MSLKELFQENIAPALKITEEEANLCNGMHEDVANAHREFAKLSPEEQKKKVQSGEF